MRLNYMILKLNRPAPRSDFAASPGEVTRLP